MSVLKERQLDLDILRICAIFAVVAIHCIASVILLKPVDSISWSIANIIEGFLRWCVPVFVMVSGALLINKKAADNPALFFKRRSSRILIPLLLWPIIYFVWYVAVFSRNIDLVDLLNGYLIGKPIGGHLYFLFLIAGLYLLTPIISNYVGSVPKKTAWKTTVCILALTTAWYLITALVPHASMGLNAITQGLPYVGYFMIGYLLKDTEVKNIKATFIIFTFSCLTTALTTYFVRHANAPIQLMFYSYQSMPVIASSISFFLLVKGLTRRYLNSKKINQRVVNRSVLWLSTMSFGIYLIHLLLLDSFIVLFSLDKGSLKIELLLIPMVIALSAIATYAISKIPRVKLLLG